MEKQPLYLAILDYVFRNTQEKVNKSSKEVFDFLNDVKNFETLMPENISKFELINEN